MKFSFLAFVMFVICFAPLAAQAGRIDILPRKIVLDDRQRSADITILNLGDKPNFVRITVISYKQNELGAYEVINTPLNPVFNPETAVRISPKQFTLPPGGRQKIRLSVQKPADLPDGEYRFHVRAISFDEEDSSVRRKLEKGSTVAMKMNVAVVIPVVVRKGALIGGAKIGNISFVPASQARQGQPALKFDLVRTGTAGVMGTMTAYQGDKEIGTMSNVNVFSEVSKRIVEMPLTQVPAAGPIRLVYTDEFGDKGVIDEIVTQK